jgi:hypothetical protein
MNKALVDAANEARKLNEPIAAPMAEIRDTAQWYTVNSQMPEIQKVLTETTGSAHRVYRPSESSGMNWERLPMLTKDALRRELYRIRAIGEEIDRQREQQQQEAERRQVRKQILTPWLATGDEPECCNPASATSEANREQEQRDLMTKYQTDAIRPYFMPRPATEITSDFLIAVAAGRHTDEAIALHVRTVAQQWTVGAIAARIEENERRHNNREG